MIQAIVSRGTASHEGIGGLGCVNAAHWEMNDTYVIAFKRNVTSIIYIIAYQNCQKDKNQRI